MKFAEHLLATEENIDRLVEERSLISFFKYAPDVKIITSKTVFKFEDTYNSTLDDLNRGGLDILKNLI